MPEILDTSKSEHRTLRFESIDDVLAELDRVEASEHAGTLRCTGNWSPGKNFGHISAWINYPYEGFPDKCTPPWFVRIVVRIMRKSFIHKPMRRGFRIPKIPEGTFGTEEYSFDDGMRRLREALARLQRREPVQFHSPVFGPMTDDERVALNLRHAECHLGFLWP